MNNQARASRHASGILPSKQFFAPRKPITQNVSARRKSSQSVLGNSPTVPPSPGAHSVATSRSTFTSAIGSQLLNLPSEDEVSLLHQPSSLALATFSSHSSPIINNNPSLDQSIDTILNSDASVINRNSAPVRPPSALLLRRQQRQQSGEGGSTELSQAVIDSVMEPITPVPVLEPSSYRQFMRQATSNGSDISSRDFAAATAYSRHSDVSPNTPSSNTKLTIMPSKKLNPSSPTKQSTFNPYALIKMPRIISSHPLPSADYRGQKRLYKQWPGRNRFFLGGRIMTSRDFPAFMVAFSALVVPSGLFMGFTCPFLFDNVSPAVVFIFVYLFLLAVTSMLRTSWSDPGIIPRNLDPSPPTEYIGENAQSNQTFAYDQARNFPLPKEVKINGQTIRLKYCETCKIYRPPRCSHCRQCDNCVENEDHHCIWLNNCIGRRNYRTFFTFIATATILCIYVLGFCLAHLLLLMKQNPLLNFFEAIMKAPVSFLLVVLSFFLMLSVGGLTGYHIYLISNNLTTHEQIRVPMARRNGNRNPFDLRNVCKNCLWVICRPMSRSSVSKRAYVDNENLQEEINGVGTRGFNEGVRSTVIAGDEIDNNTLGEGDIRVDIKEVITVNNGDGLNALQQNENNNIKEDAEQSFEPPIIPYEIDENVSIPAEREQFKESKTESMITTEPPQQNNNSNTSN